MQTSQTMKVAAVLVTHNRLSLLQQSVDAIANQTVKADALIVINNGSTDGTSEWLTTQKHVTAINKNNDGSAGAYYAGIKHAYRKGFDYIWLMDDDGIAFDNALEELINAAKIVPDFSFLCSKVISTDGSFMNVPSVDTSLSKYDYPVWGQYAENGITRVKNATYISLFINSAHLKAAGLPSKDFFFWADDIDFTARLYKQAPGYMVGKSIVKHLRINPSIPSILNEMDKKRLKLHYYNIRNGLYLSKRDNRKTIYFIDLLAHARNMFVSLLKTYGFMRFRIYLRGFFASFFFKPRIEYLDAQAGH